MGMHNIRPFLTIMEFILAFISKVALFDLLLQGMMLIFGFMRRRIVFLQTKSWQNRSALGIQVTIDSILSCSIDQLMPRMLTPNDLLTGRKIPKA